MLTAFLVANLLLNTPPGATPPPGGTGPVAGDLSGRWEIRLRGLPRGYPERLVVRLEHQETRVSGQVLVPRSRAFVTGKMLGRLYLVEIRPLAVRGGSATYRLEVSLDPTSSRGNGSVRAWTADRRPEAAGSLEMTRLDPGPGPVSGN